MTEPLIRTAVVGAGYWGRNLVRNFLASDEFELDWLCDTDKGAARTLLGRRSPVKVTADVSEIIGDPEVEAIVITTPAGTHAPLALAALRAGKHVFVEKPLADSSAQAAKVIAEAKKVGRTLLVDHTYCYAPPLDRIASLIEEGHIGVIDYFDSTRINLGLVRIDVDVIWDLCPHDLAILLSVLPAGVVPVAVRAIGSDPLDVGSSYAAHVTIHMSDGSVAHIHDSWLSPIKVRTVVIGGSEGTIVWNDLDPNAPLAVYDASPDLARTGQGRPSVPLTIPLQWGDMTAPAVEQREPLQAAVAEFARAIRTGEEPKTGGDVGLRIVRLLEAATTSVNEDGRRVEVQL